MCFHEKRRGRRIKKRDCTGGTGFLENKKEKAAFKKRKKGCLKRGEKG